MVSLSHGVLRCEISSHAWFLINSGVTDDRATCVNMFKHAMHFLVNVCNLQLFLYCQYYHEAHVKCECPLSMRLLHWWRNINEAILLVPPAPGLLGIREALAVALPVLCHSTWNMVSSTYSDYNLLYKRVCCHDPSLQNGVTWWKMEKWKARNDVPMRRPGDQPPQNGQLQSTFLRLSHMGIEKLDHTSHQMILSTIRAPNAFQYHFVNIELPFQWVACTYECVDKCTSSSIHTYTCAYTCACTCAYTCAYTCV